jgi:aspartate-semialdehyde dehydrogenase
MIAMPVLAPVRDAVGIKRVIVTSFQAVSGAGVAGVKELSEQIEALGDNAALLTFSG